MKQADKSGTSRVLIVGEDELRAGQGVLRDMKTRDEQQQVELQADVLHGRLRPPRRDVDEQRSIVKEPSA
jgi:histidyl-tRNA synthetase